MLTKAPRRGLSGPCYRSGGEVRRIFSRSWQPIGGPNPARIFVRGALSAMTVLLRTGGCFNVTVPSFVLAELRHVRALGWQPKAVCLPRSGRVRFEIEGCVLSAEVSMGCRWR